ncbi:MAG: class I SAM-dependent methyltransferase [Mesorhizobium sp.]|nr:MAG: class I SAM-dependent methyltransferase [Mesorhizobium sp.]
MDSPLAVVRSVRSSIAGLRILDIGCGAGSFARQLVAEGADVSGIDPAADAIRQAAAAVPQASFVEGGAEALPFDDAAFDIGVMVNTLHHVPEMAMQAALGEAARVIKLNGSLIIVEPLASGNFFAALRTIEDETIVRRAAQLAIKTAVLSGVLARMATLQYVRREAFPSVRGFLDRIVAVDPSRREVVECDEPGITAAVLAAAQRDSEGALIFDQPIKADILRPA